MGGRFCSFFFFFGLTYFGPWPWYFLYKMNAPDGSECIENPSVLEKENIMVQGDLSKYAAGLKCCWHTKPCLEPITCIDLKFTAST